MYSLLFDATGSTLIDTTKYHLLMTKTVTITSTSSHILSPCKLQKILVKQPFLRMRTLLHGTYNNKFLGSTSIKTNFTLAFARA